MENIVINGLMYKCKNGTNDKIKELLVAAEKAPAMDHEKGTAYNLYDFYLWQIIDTKNGAFIENVYRTS